MGSNILRIGNWHLSVVWVHPLPGYAYEFRQLASCQTTGEPDLSGGTVRFVGSPVASLVFIVLVQLGIIYKYPVMHTCVHPFQPGRSDTSRISMAAPQNSSLALNPLLVIAWRLPFALRRLTAILRPLSLSPRTTPQ